MLHAIETEQRKSRKSTRIGDTMDAMKSWTTTRTQNRIAA